MGDACSDWTLAGAEGETIFISSHCATSPNKVRAAALIAHGFKGYKDYGFLPLLAHHLATTLPIVVHRFNFSHSGMTNNIETFERPDLFQIDTWSKQVFDLDCLINAIASGAADRTPPAAPFFLLGHSRGGTTCLLTAGRRHRDARRPFPSAIVTMASPDATCTLDQDTIKRMRTQGFLVSPSARTKQTLRQDRIWLDEQVANPADHDVLTLAREIRYPVLAVHGEADVTVPPTSARQIADACRDGAFVLIPEGNHVFNTPNPADPEAPPSPALAMLLDHVTAHLKRALESMS